MTEESTDKLKLDSAIQVLDRLLGVAARQPGTAAKLPAVIRVIESLEPAGGMDFPIFPASYAGSSDNDPPVYDLSGVVYGETQETIRVKKATVSRPQIIRAERCALDSPQSQANRTEVAFTQDHKLTGLVPKAVASIPRKAGTNGSESVLCLPHRVADFRVRLSDKRAEVESAITAFGDGDVSELLRLMPTSLIFGFWDSRSEGAQLKHARILLSRIDAFDVVPCRRHALYSGPYSADEFAAEVLGKAKAEKAESDEMAKQGFTNAPSEGLGGVLVKNKIERLALISLTDIARLNCRTDDGTIDGPKTDAARRYLFALAALAEAHPRSTGSHRLRSGCELVAKSGTTVDLRGGDSPYKEAEALLHLYSDRDTLVAVAAHAKGILGIPNEIGPFCVTQESLKAGFSRPAVQPTADSPEGPAPQSKPRTTRKSR